MNRIQTLKRKYAQQQARLQAEINKEQTLQQELTILQEQFSANVLTDVLTGLPGKKTFEDHLQLTVNQCQRYQLTCSVMFLDLDGFKMINDALGYDVGDALLKEVAQRLQTCVRKVDTVSRFAADEFVFIFSQINKAETAVYIAQRLLDAISQPFVIQGHELYVTAGVGISVFPLDGNDAKVLLKNADLALHQAKLRGRNTYQFYHAEMHALSCRELLLTSSLHNEAIYQQFKTYYQPRINLTTRQIVCMESTLEWQHSEFGLVTYNELSRLAEKDQNIVTINDWLLRNACHDLVRWREAGIAVQAVSVPLALKQLENSHFLQKLSTLLQETKLEPASIIFEITESSLLDKIDLVEKVLHMLKRLGIQIAINNFGAGRLQLQHLRRLPIDIFKIDHSLIFDVDTNQESEAIVRMIIVLANSLQASVAADGVENLEQKNLLESLGCIEMQGSLICAPVLPAVFSEKTVNFL